MAYLIDTDILIYSLKNHPEVTENFKKRADTIKSISVITYGELIFGAFRLRKREANMAKARRIGELFSIVDILRAVVETFAELKSTLYSKGKPVDDMDLLIGATAVAYNYVLVTNNIQHFAQIPGITLESWETSK